MLYRVGRWLAMGLLWAGAAQAQKPDRNLITADEIAAASVNTAQQAVEKLRPDWLRRAQLQRTAEVGASVALAVFVDGNEAGGASELQRISAEQIREIRFTPGAEAATQFGSRFAAGIIHVRLKTGQAGRGRPEPAGAAAGGAGAVAGPGAAGGAAAAAPAPSGYIPPLCSGARTTDRRVNEGANALREAVRDPSPGARATLLRQAKLKLFEGLSRGGKDAEPAAWLYLGQVYLYENDLPGADSALTRAVKLAPDCAGDVDRSRQAAWLPLVNAGVELAKGGNTDSALTLFRRANLIYRDSPSAYTNIGVLYANRGGTDSAIAYFTQARDIATRVKMDEERNEATLNLGLMLSRAKRYDEAIKTLEEYRTWAPNDTAGARVLAGAYRGAGKTERAERLEREFGISPAEAAGGGADLTARFQQGVELFNQGKYEEAAAVFAEVFQKQPVNHDALLNQATSYFRGQNGPKLVETASKLAELEPLHEIALRLLEQGYKLTKQTDKQIATVARVAALPVKVETGRVKVSPTELTVAFTATGRAAKDAKGNPLAARGVKLHFEMLGGDGSVLATQDLEVPALAPEQTQQYTVEGKADGIVAWRYKVAP